MPVYEWVRDPETGRGAPVLVDPVSAFSPKAQPPEPAVELPVPRDAVVVWRCNFCGESYKVAGLAAKHFRKEHSEANENTESWREWVVKVQE